MESFGKSTVAFTPELMNSCVVPLCPDVNLARVKLLGGSRGRKRANAEDYLLLLYGLNSVVSETTTPSSNNLKSS